MAAATAGLVTFAQLEQLPDPPGGRYELHHGELIHVAPPKQRHNRIQHRLLRIFWALNTPRFEVAMELGFRSDPEHDYRIADVALISRQRFDRIELDDNLHGAVEVDAVFGDVE